MTNAAIMVIAQIAGAIECIRIERGKWRQVMIIFDLDGTLADCEHRRHFVDPTKNPDVIHGIPPNKRTGGVMIMQDYLKSTGELWQPDWPAFYEACDKDEPIEPVIAILADLFKMNEIQIWSGRSESVRDKTMEWLEKHTIFSFAPDLDIPLLKMRPIGNTEPDEVLKERWLDEAIVEGKKIDFVFDDRPKVVRMWRRRGIFVFNCCQHDEEF